MQIIPSRTLQHFSEACSLECWKACTIMISCLPLLQVNDVNFENMSNDDAVRVLREMVHKPG